MVELDLPKEQIAKEYINGMSTIKLGKKYSCNPGTISDRLRKMGINLKGRGGNRKISKKELLKRRKQFHEFLQEDSHRKIMLINLIIECMERVNYGRN
jgi:hypothetical protein